MGLGQRCAGRGAPLCLLSYIQHAPHAVPPFALLYQWSLLLSAPQMSHGPSSFPLGQRCAGRAAPSCSRSYTRHALHAVPPFALLFQLPAVLSAPQMSHGPSSSMRLGQRCAGRAAPLCLLS